MMLEAVLILAAAAPGTCHEREHLQDYFRGERGMALQSWGLDDDGHELELWLRPDGNFAVIVTTPEHCSWAVTPWRHHGKLSMRPFSATPDDRPAERQECTTVPGGMRLCREVREPLTRGWPM